MAFVVAIIETNLAVQKTGRIMLIWAIRSVTDFSHVVCEQLEFVRVVCEVLN